MLTQGPVTTLTASRPKTVACIGECMVEIAPLPGAADGTCRRGFAGDTLNTAWYLRQLLPVDAFTVSYITAVGDDRISGDLLAFIASAGIDVSRAEIIPGKTAGLYMISLQGAERSFTYWRETSAARLLARDADALAKRLESVDVAYFSGITLAIVGPHRPTLLDVLQAFRACGGTVVFDANIRLRLWESADAAKAWISAACAVADIALPTFPDEADLYGDASIAATRARLESAGCAEMVIKDGADPCLVVSHGDTGSVAAQKVTDAVDTTGAGDSFNAGYLAARLQGQDALASAAAGHRVAGEVIRHPGALVRL